VHLSAKDLRALNLTPQASPVSSTSKLTVRSDFSIHLSIAPIEAKCDPTTFHIDTPTTELDTRTTAFRRYNGCRLFYRGYKIATGNY
jgi:hypothetical protein